MNFIRKLSFFIHSHQPDSLEIYFSNQPDNLYYRYLFLSLISLGGTAFGRPHFCSHHFGGALEEADTFQPLSLLYYLYTYTS